MTAGTRAWRAASVIVAGSLVAIAFESSCAGGEHASCLAPLPLDCQAAFPPTYTDIYDNLFGETCGGPSTGGSCHGPDGKKAGLVLSDRSNAYDYLVGMVDGRARVVPSKPECSLIERRLESDDPGFVMPPGARLSVAERCAVRQWIAGGAKRD